MKVYHFILLVVLSLTNPIISVGQDANVRQKHFYVEDDYAIDGYDPVAYVTEGKAKEGDTKYTTTYKGITYLFSSESNKNKFTDSPEKYMPAYGGWCAYAIAAKGDKMAPDPETFIIQDGKLYLFYNGFFNNTLPKWEKKPKEMKTKADKKWSEIVKQ